MDITDASGIAGKPYSDLAQPGSVAVTRPRQKISLELFDELEPVCHDWQALEAEAVCTPFHTYAWSHAWRTHVESMSEVRTAIVVGRDDNGTVQMILPLALRKHGPVTALEWLSGEHATYTGGLFHPSFLNQLSKTDFLVLWSRVVALLPPFDIVQFLAQMPMIDGWFNPTTHLGARTSANSYFCITIDAEWEELHRQRRSKSTRRSERRRERQLNEIGPMKFETHFEGPALAQATEVMFKQRSARFGEQGIHDFLSDAGMTGFYRALTKMTARSHGIEGYVSSLSVGDTMAAGLLNLIHKNKNYALVSSMTTDETLRKSSPGEILMRHTLKYCCETGLEAYDCGGGYDIYKDSWSDIKFHTADTVAPRTMLGSAYDGSYNGFLMAKSHIKQSPVLWKAFKTLRKLGFWS